MLAELQGKVTGVHSCWPFLKKLILSRTVGTTISIRPTSVNPIWYSPNFNKYAQTQCSIPFDNDYNST